MFNEIRPNPTTKNVMDSAKKIRENNCDFVVAFGGGSDERSEKIDGVSGNGCIFSRGGKCNKFERASDGRNVRAQSD